MSRDFTPRELYLVEKEMKPSLRDIKIVNDKGEEIIFSKTPEGAKERYPELTFLVSDQESLFGSADTIVDLTEDRKRVLDAIEEKIQNIEEGNGLNEEDPFLFVEQWFCGKLDPNFYYREENERLFLSEIEKSEKRIRNPQTKAFVENDKKRRKHGIR